MALALPPQTEVVAQRPVPAVERFLDRRGSGWNLTDIFTVFPARVEEELVLEHMRLQPTGKAVLAEVQIGEPLRFRSRPGDFDFDPGEE